MSKRARGFAITLNNYNDNEYNQLLEIAQLHSEKYIFGKEVGKEGTPHIQGYLYFENGKSFSAVKKLLDNQRIHIEIAGGSPKQNYDYCSKENNFECKGFETLGYKGTKGYPFMSNEMRLMLIDDNKELFVGRIKKVSKTSIKTRLDATTTPEGWAGEN